MDRTLPLALLTGCIGIVTVLLGNVTTLAVQNDGIPPAEALTWLTMYARFGAFVLVYVVLFGLAYWAGRSLDLRVEYGTVVGLPVLLGAVGALAAHWYVAGLADTEMFDLLTLIGIALARSVATGIELGVVVLAGAALAAVRQADTASV